MTVIVGPPTFEHHREALGIGEVRPRVSWKTRAGPGWSQVAYELEVTRGELTVTSGRVSSPVSVLVPWPGVALASREGASVRVRVWGDEAAPSAWSEASMVEAGLVGPLDWTAAPVGPGWSEDPGRDDRRPPLVRRTFSIAGRPVKARLYASAHGLYEIELNGSRVGREAMAPGWTVYGSRLRYLTYDVSELVTEGDNAIGAWLGDGWYRGRLGWNGGFRNLYGQDVGLIAQLEISTADGRALTIH